MHHKTTRKRGNACQHKRDSDKSARAYAPCARSANWVFLTACLLLTDAVMQLHCGAAAYTRVNKSAEWITFSAARLLASLFAFPYTYYLIQQLGETWRHGSALVRSCRFIHTLLSGRLRDNGMVVWLMVISSYLQHTHALLANWLADVWRWNHMFNQYSTSTTKVSGTEHVW